MIRLPAPAFCLAAGLLWAGGLTLSVGPAEAAPRRVAPPSTVCSQQVGAFRFALNDELRAATLEPSVYATILAELGPVADACRAGDDAQAGKLLRALKRRWRFL